MSKFKVGDKVRCVVSGREDLTYGRVYEIISTYDTWYRVLNDCNEIDGYAARLFELLDNSTTLTPEEVFSHLRKGTPMQIKSLRYTPRDVTSVWVDIDEDFTNGLLYEKICSATFRLKPEPEVIELNGKKYREIVE